MTFNISRATVTRAVPVPCVFVALLYIFLSVSTSLTFFQFARLEEKKGDALKKIS